MKNKEKNLNIFFQNEEKKIEKGKAILTAIIAFAVSFGLFGACAEAFDCIKNSYICVVPALAAFIVPFFFLSKFEKYFTFALLALPVGIGAALFQDFKNGFFLLSNEVLDFLTLKSGKIYFEIALSENEHGEFAFLLISVFAAAVISIAIVKKNLIFSTLAIALSMLGFLFGFLSTGMFFAVFALGCAAEVIIISLPENGAFPKIKNLAVVSAMFLLCIIVSVASAKGILSKPDDNISEAIKNGLHGMAYDNKANSMPEGNLETLGAWNKSKTPALKVTMSKPQKLYLKGFVGEEYTSEGWKNLDSEKFYENAESFYWMHTDGFFPQTANSSALEITGNDSEENIVIENISACKENAFLPYSFSSTEMLDSSVLIDSEIKSFGSAYEINYIPSGLSEWYLAQIELYEAQKNNSNVQEYLKNEKIYRDFVYANYLNIPEKTNKTFEHIFADIDTEASFTEVINAIQGYLSENITYNENVITKNGETDFVDYFLTKNTKGYSVHYATAATMMFRYFGIPARYVEGYFISAESAEKIGENETVILTEENAHAWTEYYLDGVGWIPFEVTPGYMDDEFEKAAFSVLGETEDIPEKNDRPKTNIIEEKERDNLKENGTSVEAVLTALAALFGLLLIALAVYIINGRKRLKKAFARMSEAENKEAIILQFAYAEMLSKKAKFSKEELCSLGREEVYLLNIEALFSEHSMTDEQRAKADGYKNEVLLQCKNKWNFFEKIVNRWIKFIY